MKDVAAAARPIRSQRVMTCINSDTPSLLAGSGGPYDSARLLRAALGRSGRRTFTNGPPTSQGALFRQEVLSNYSGTYLLGMRRIPIGVTFRVGSPVKFGSMLLVLAALVAGCRGRITDRDGGPRQQIDLLNARYPDSHSHTTYCSHAEKLDRKHERGRISSNEYIHRNRSLFGSTTGAGELLRRLDENLRRGKISKDEYIRSVKWIHDQECRD